MTTDPDSGGDPTTLGRCAACGETYPVHEVDRGEFHPVGTDGTCVCGNDEFEIIQPD